jgi:hypothetical protein
MKRRLVPLPGLQTSSSKLLSRPSCDRDGNEVRQENASVLAYEKLCFNGVAEAGEAPDN